MYISMKGNACVPPSSIGSPADRELLDGSTPAVLERILEDALSLVEEDGLAAKACLAQAMVLLRGRAAGSVSRSTQPTACRQALAPWQVRRVANHVRDNLGATIRIGDLASLTRLSAGYFTRAFRDSFGVTPQAYIVRRRMERAKWMLMNTEEPLCQIALECGHCDQAHFSRVFRRVHGLAPGAWRRERRAG